MKIQDFNGTPYEVIVDHQLEEGRSMVFHRGHVILALTYTSLREHLARGEYTEEQLRTTITEAVDSSIRYYLSMRTGPAFKQAAL